MKKMFKIWDNQLSEYRGERLWFTTKTAVDRLASFHNQDWTDEAYENIQDYLEKEFSSDEERLCFLGEYGNWDFHPAIYHDTDDLIVGGEYDRKDKIKEFLAENKGYTVEYRYCDRGGYASLAGSLDNI